MSVATKVFPWLGIAKIGLAIGGVGAVLAFAYFKGSADKNAHWLAKENARIAREAEATIKGMREAHKINIGEAKEWAGALARADERAIQAEDRADDAEKSRNAQRKQNNVLFADLKDAQNQAARSGDNAGRALLPVRVREQLGNRLDELCRRRPAECTTILSSEPEIQENTPIGLAGPPNP